MKKVYTKPEIMFESFTLSENIAGDCEQIYSLHALDICGIPDANGVGDTIFNVSASGTDCIVPGGDSDTYNGFCYHIPTETNNLFNS